MGRRILVIVACLIILLSVFTVFKPFNSPKVEGEPLNTNTYSINGFRAGSFYELYNFLFDWYTVTKTDAKLTGDDLRKIETFLDKTDRFYKNIKLDSENVIQKSYNIVGFHEISTLFAFEEKHQGLICVCLKYFDGNLYYLNSTGSKVGFSNGWIQDRSPDRIEFTYTQNREVSGTEDFMIKYLTSIDSQSLALKQNGGYHNIKISTLYSAYLWLIQFKTLE